MINKLKKNVALIISIVLFTVSLTQEAYCNIGGCRAGYDVLISGALLGFLTGGAAITWLANPLLFASWIWFNKRKNLSLEAGLLAAAIAFSFLFFSKTGDNESGEQVLITGYRSGYWLWAGSHLTMAIGNIILYIKNRK